MTSPVELQVVVPLVQDAAPTPVPQRREGRVWMRNSPGEKCNWFIYCIATTALSVFTMISDGIQSNSMYKANTAAATLKVIGVEAKFNNMTINEAEYFSELGDIRSNQISFDNKIMGYQIGILLTSVVVSFANCIWKGSVRSEEPMKYYNRWRVFSAISGAGTIALGVFATNQGYSTAGPLLLAVGATHISVSLLDRHISRVCDKTNSVFNCIWNKFSHR